jgi:hypothetical protein
MNSLTPLDKYSDGEPVEIPVEKLVEKSANLKTNYKDLKKRYELAERMVWAKLPTWKRSTIIECKVTGVYDNRIFDEYSKEIVALAENEDTVLSENYPPVPHLSVEKIPLTK